MLSLHQFLVAITDNGHFTGGLGAGVLAQIIMLGAYCARAKENKLLAWALLACLALSYFALDCADIVVHNIVLSNGLFIGSLADWFCAGAALIFVLWSPTSPSRIRVKHLPAILCFFTVYCGLFFSWVLTWAVTEAVISDVKVMLPLAGFDWAAIGLYVLGCYLLFNIPDDSIPKQSSPYKGIARFAGRFIGCHYVFFVILGLLFLVVIPCRLAGVPIYLGFFICLAYAALMAGLLFLLSRCGQFDVIGSELRLVISPVSGVNLLQIYYLPGEVTVKSSTVKGSILRFDGMLEMFLPGTAENYIDVISFARLAGDDSGIKYAPVEA